MPHTRALHETSQSTSQSLEVADILAMQHKAKGLVQAQHKGKAGSQLTSTISKPPSSSECLGDEAAPPETESLTKCASPMPFWESNYLSHSRSPSPAPSIPNTQQLDAPTSSKCSSIKQYKKHPVSSDSKSTSSDVPSHAKCKSKWSKCNSTRALYQEILQAIHDSKVSHSTESALSCATLPHCPVDSADVVAPPLPEGNPFVTIDQHLSKYLQSTFGHVKSRPHLHLQQQPPVLDTLPRASGGLHPLNWFLNGPQLNPTPLNLFQVVFPGANPGITGANPGIRKCGIAPLSTAPLTSCSTKQENQTTNHTIRKGKHQRLVESTQVHGKQESQAKTTKQAWVVSSRASADEVYHWKMAFCTEGPEGNKASQLVEQRCSSS